MRRRSFGWIAFCAPLVLYAFTAHRFVGFWDTGEMDTVPYILGIAHPPGLPLYTLAGWLFSHVVPFGSVAFRMSLFSALSMSGAAWFVYAIVVDLNRSRLAGCSAALLFAAGAVAWTVATRADVHALEACAYAAALWAWVRWYAGPSRRRLFGAAALFGLAVAVHPLGLFVLPAALLLVLGRLHEIEHAPLFTAAAISLVTAAIWFLYLPLRSVDVSMHHLDPSATFGLPGGAFWDYDHPATLTNFTQLVFARDVGVADAFHAYASDRIGSGFATLTVVLVRELSAFGVMAALAGIVTLWRSRALLCAAVLFAGIAPALFGFVFTDESDATRYALPACIAMSVFAGVAAGSVRNVRLRRAGAYALAASCAFLVLTQLSRFSQAGDRTALDQVDTILAKTPDDAVLVAGWTLAPPLAYRAYVDRAAGHRTILAYWWGEIGGVIGDWPAQRPIFVVGPPEGSVPGFRLERLSAYPELYRAERTTAKL